jgi:hypothetical protein
MRKRNEGSEEQRQASSRMARRQGKSPRAEGLSTGRSKQERHANGSAGYREKLESHDKGRQSSKQHGSEPKPGNRRAFLRAGAVTAAVGEGEALRGRRRAWDRSGGFDDRHARHPLSGSISFERIEPFVTAGGGRYPVSLGGT